MMLIWRGSLVMGNKICAPHVYKEVRRPSRCNVPDDLFIVGSHGLSKLPQIEKKVWWSSCG